MATVQDILTAKGTQVHCIAPHKTVLEATQLMNRYQIGALVVMEDHKVLGIFTERDVLRRVVAEASPPDRIAVADVMTRQVICVRPETDLDEVGAIMKTRRIRHLPVCDPAGAMVGIVSIGDVNAHYASNQEQTIHFLSDYIYGRA